MKGPEVNSWVDWRGAKTLKQSDHELKRAGGVLPVGGCTPQQDLALLRGLGKPLKCGEYRTEETDPLGW